MQKLHLTTVTVATRLTKVAKVAQKLHSIPKVAQSRENVKTAQKLCRTTSQFSRGSIKTSDDTAIKCSFSSPTCSV